MISDRARASARLFLAGGLTAALLLATLASFAPGLGGAASGAAGESGASLDDQPANRGKSLFPAKGCIACHSLTVPGDPTFIARVDPQLGPSLTGIAAVAATRRSGLGAADYLRESILEPQSFVVPGYATAPSGPGYPQMPTLPITSEEADALVTFLLDPR